MYSPYNARLLNGEIEQIVCLSLDDCYDHKEILDQIAESSPFTLTLFTQKSQQRILSDPARADVLKNAVAYAHSKGLKFGVEVAQDCERPSKLEDMLGIAVHTVSPITAEDLGLGRKQIRVEAAGQICFGGNNKANLQQVRLLKAYLYKQIDWCHFETGSLLDITDLVSFRFAESGTAVASVSLTADKLGTVGGSNAVAASAEMSVPSLSGYVLHVITVHYYDCPHLWSKPTFDAIESAVEAYAPARPDGAILNSASIYLRLPDSADAWYNENMSAEYQHRTGRKLEEDLLYMKVSPAGEDVRRSKVLTDYFDLHRSQAVRLEHAFYEAVKNFFGSDAFVAVDCGEIDCCWIEGVAEEMWRNGLSLWDSKRDFGIATGFGQAADSGLATSGIIPAVGLALGRKWGSRVWYDIFHTDDPDVLCQHAVEIARVGGRIRYTAPDGPGWLGSSFDLRRISKIENTIRLLNWFQTGLPESDIVVVMGYPEMVTADKPGTKLGLNSNYAAGFEIAQMLWDMGYRCDLVPSYEIDDNDLRICCSGGVHYGLTGSYKLLVYILPEYSKLEALDFLDRYLAAGGKLVLIGDCTKDTSGNDATGRIATLRRSSLAAFGQISFSSLDKALLESTFAQIGLCPNDISDGVRFNDREVVIVQDCERLLSDKISTAEFTLGNQAVSADFAGLLALRLSKDGSLERLAASKLVRLAIGGIEIFKFEQPKAVLASRGGQGELLVVYPEESMIPEILSTPS